MKNIELFPVFTEKSNALKDKQNKYVFNVPLQANKIEVAQLIEQNYKVDVLSVNTIRYGGGKHRVKFTNKGIIRIAKTRYKRAIVEIKSGQSIEMLDVKQ
jgi:large subunit ribosomal protein L23